MTITDPILSNLNVRPHLGGKNAKQVDMDNEDAEQVIMDNRGVKEVAMSNKRATEYKHERQGRQ